jgi:hypothetical protein
MARDNPVHGRQTDAASFKLIGPMKALKRPE